MSHVPEDDAVEWAKAPSPVSSSFEAQMLALLPALRRYARSLSRSDGDGEDLLHDSVLRAISNRAQWRGVNLRAWIFAIMTNLNRNKFRGSKPTLVELDAADQVATDDGDMEPIARIRLAQALNTIASDHRAVLMLVVIEGYKYHEVASMLDIPLGTVMSRLSRARQSLADALGEDKIIPLRRPK
ncbi:MAG: RNA polymerase sigma factor [Hoeflea sp.]|uniref:RNA polymerase sigma factor n=1 Tax=Hoeflea sp. TaxID=1940281 RepID=UPI003EF83477